MLENYAVQNGLEPFLHLSDDGYSEGNFSRPAWQELITRVKDGEVGTICVKNSDRMGRNYLQVGLYREMFRECGVRLIAIHDNVDTALGEDDFLPFREIMAEWYLRDTSKKIKAVYQTKGRSGKPVTSTPPYGFVKDPDDKTKWLVDTEAAAVVRRIFQMTIDGMGVHTIAGILAEEKIERPSYYLGSRGRGRHKNDYDREQPYAWGSATIGSILRHMEYTGATVNFRSTGKDFKSKKREKNAPENWLIFPNTHEAIITQEEFDLVQKLRETPRRIDHLGEANPLTGLLWCADCGAKLYNHRKAHTEKPTHTKLTDVYCCSTYKLSNSKFNTQCSAHHISTEAVRTIILDAIRKTTGYVREHEAEFVEKLREVSAVKQGETAKEYKKQLAKSERRLSELDKIYRSLYEDKALEKISEEMYAEMTSGYERERAELKEKTAALQAELDEFISDGERADRFIEIVQRYTEFTELTPCILNEFVDKVIVYEGVWSEGNRCGSRRQQVDVYLKYIGNFDAPDMRTPEQIEADRIAEEKLEANRAYHREKTRQSAERKRQREAATA
jgi:DNA invertase Pin-like site-specific DNA recombinase